MRPVLVVLTLGVAMSTALLHARGIAALATPLLAPPPIEESGGGRTTRPVSEVGSRARSAAPVLARNPFDHEASGASAADAGAPPHEDELPSCSAVRALFTLQGEDEEGSLAALDLDGRRIVRARGGDVGERVVLRVGFDRVLLGRTMTDDVCVARVFAPATGGTRPKGAPALLAPVPSPATASPLGRSIVRVSPTETHLDGSALDALEGALTSGKLRAAPDREGGRMLGLRLGPVAKGDVPDLLGLATGDRVEAISGLELDDTSALLAGWARLRAVREGRIPVRIQRGGKTLQLDIVIR